MAINTPIELHNQVVKYLQDEGPVSKDWIRNHFSLSEGVVNTLIATLSFKYPQLWETDGGVLVWTEIGAQSFIY